MFRAPTFVHEDVRCRRSALNRRRFLGCSAAAGLALSQGERRRGRLRACRLRVGLVGLGNRGTTLLRAALELPGVEIAAVVRSRAASTPAPRQGIVEKAGRSRPEALEHWGALLGRPEVEAVVIALPCDLHAASGLDALRAGKHLYVEKPLAPDPGRLRRTDRRGRPASRPGRPRRLPAAVATRGYREAVELIRRGELGRLIEGRAAWISSNGPILAATSGWLGRRARSGDWMVEQAVHVWDLYQLGRRRAARSGPTATGRRDLFADREPGRDVTDHYTATLEWAGGFHLQFVHSWIDPADDAFTGARQQIVGTAGGLDFATGVPTFRDRNRARPRVAGPPPAETAHGLDAFVRAIRADEPLPPPISLAEARDATRIGLLVRRAVDERRVVSIDEIDEPTSLGEVVSADLDPSRRSGHDRA